MAVGLGGNNGISILDMVGRNSIDNSSWHQGFVALAAEAERAKGSLAAPTLVTQAAGELREGRQPPAAIAAVFIAGYRDAGGRPAWEGNFINIVIPCESDWQLDPPGYYLGLAQFNPWTWAAAGGGDYTDPYLQGHHVAVWSNRVDPASRGGWLGTWYGC